MLPVFTQLRACTLARLGLGRLAPEPSLWALTLSPHTLPALPPGELPCLPAWLGFAVASFPLPPPLNRLPFSLSSSLCSLCLWCWPLVWHPVLCVSSSPSHPFGLLLLLLFPSVCLGHTLICSLFPWWPMYLRLCVCLCLWALDFVHGSPCPYPLMPSTLLSAAYLCLPVSFWTHCFISPFCLDPLSVCPSGCVYVFQSIFFWTLPISFPLRPQWTTSGFIQLRGEEFWLFTGLSLINHHLYNHIKATGFELLPTGRQCPPALSSCHVDQWDLLFLFIRLWYSSPLETVGFNVTITAILE